MKKFHVSIAVCVFAFALASFGVIDLSNLFNYANQPVPAYIQKDNTPGNNQLSNATATLGRVLFYDKKLSLNNTIACASCHKQEFAFGDNAALSVGFEGGQTGRHSMRLANARFGTETKFFWDERASSLEQQTTMPIQDHVEMGFSGMNGQPNIDSLVNKLQGLSYYQVLFNLAFGTPTVTENRIRLALAQFVRSIQSFDSKFDIGRAQAPNDGAPFPNFTAQENQGKQVFLTPPPNGAGCQGCHRAPEFDIDPASLNNGIIGVAGGTGVDLTNTRAPSLRNLFNPSGQLNGPMMHNAVFTDINQVINHYNLVPQSPQNTNLDPRLQGPGGNLQLTQNQKDALVAFLKTLTGSAIYTDERWSDPFDANGNLELTNVASIIINNPASDVNVYPNPASEFISIKLPDGDWEVLIFNNNGLLVKKVKSSSLYQMSIEELSSGIYRLNIKNTNTGQWVYSSFIKR